MIARRCVVTGLGLICALGANVDECFDNAQKGVSGIKHATLLNTDGCYTDLVAEVPREAFSHKGWEYSRASALIIKAAKEAMSDADFSPNQTDPNVSVVVGSCVGGADSGEVYYSHAYVHDEATDKALISEMPIFALGKHVAKLAKAGGAVLDVANACAAGTMAIAYGADLIATGKAEVVIVGGADSMGVVSFAGFHALHALDTNGCSPFNRSQGITLGEGAGMLVLESYEHARKRGGKIYCEVSGSGISGDAYDLTAPRPDGEGQISAIKAALADAGLSPEQIDYVNAHGTGTEKNDGTEILSLKHVFGENAGLSVSSTKGLTGHCLGAAGAIESVFCIKMMNSDKVLPTVGFGKNQAKNIKEREQKSDFIVEELKEKKLGYVMNNSFAFGGSNASVIFGKGESPKKNLAGSGAVISGIGMVLPMGNGTDAYIERHGQEKTLPHVARAEVGAEDYLRAGIKPAFYRKLDSVSKFQVISGKEALADGRAGEETAGYGIIVGTAMGALGSGSDFQALIAEKGTAGGSAFKFPNTVYNAAGGHMSVCAGIKGINVTLAGGDKSGLESVAFAADGIRMGRTLGVLASGSDEAGEALSEQYFKLNGKEAVPLSEGSVSLLIESDKLPKHTERAPYCRIRGYGFGASSDSGKQGLITAIKNALNDAGASTSDMDVLFGFSYGVPEPTEETVYADVFEKIPPVIEVKERIGNGRAVTATLACAHAALMLGGRIDEAEGYVVDRANGLGWKRTVVKADRIKRVMVAARSTDGSYCVVILERYK